MFPVILLITADGFPALNPNHTPWGPRALSFSPDPHDGRVHAGFCSDLDTQGRAGCWRDGRLSACSVMGLGRCVHSVVSVDKESLLLPWNLPALKFMMNSLSPLPEGAARDRLKACIYGKWHILNKMLIKDTLSSFCFTDSKGCAVSVKTKPVGEGFPSPT